MKTYSSYKNQIEGFSDVSETVKTVEKIAASSIHFLKNKVNSLNIYAQNIENIMLRLSDFYTDNQHEFLKTRQNNRKMLVVISGNKGLVGGLWHNITNIFLDNKDKYESIVVVGEKGEKYLLEEKITIQKTFAEFSDIPQREQILELTAYLFEKFKNKSLSNIDVIYPRFLSLAEQEATLIPFLPFDFALSKQQKPEQTKKLGLPIFAQSKQKIFSGLLEKYIAMSMHRIILESKLSELSARTVAMEHATVKTDELIKKIKLNFKKDQRRIITTRQLESFTAHKVKTL
ncbi:MAG: hypothetical protein COU28_00335 [Candidatus Magasanikbacteria bacterium CG10_big_fil_rev_8_21_14_0_10_36_16]|uniref:F0F1 ATP synthase subunit gamma n=1 Tax=Candidatus Magasanikbacteria bacterium CG10_big_fil_rev_8_21_14_0_10_36_16 TaxID=1974645 RepID=A0A2H0TZL6_9BACT|nr:MAG: hypothetical protein COU28_00335 [Candidatus Magasanikbacteria bacterium CG10_big_fil_rev_8_21_14_0_10_36_16]